MVICDTSIIIDHLRHPENTVSYLQRLSESGGEEIALSVISVQELYEGKSTLKPKAENVLLAIIQSLRIVPYTYEVAHAAGIIARDSLYKKQFADLAIAATTIINGAQLYTLNIKDFTGIARLKLYKIS